MAEVPTLNSLTSLTNETSAIALINANFQAILTVLADAFSRSGASPNTLTATVDHNSQHIVNLPSPAGPTEPLRVEDLPSYIAAALTAQTLTGGLSIASLPTTLPVIPGILWNNGGVLCVS